MIKEDNSSRIYELDALRAFAFLFVVAQHLFGGFAWRDGVDPVQSFVLSFLFVIAKPAVSIFIVLVGINLFLYSKHKRPDFKEFYKKKVKRLFIPYIIWCVFLIILSGNYGKLTNILGILVTGSGDYHLWYMGMLIRVILFFPLIWFVFNYVYSRGKLTRNILFAMFVVAFWAVSKNKDVITQSFIDFIFNHPSNLQAIFVQISPVFWSLYFVIGVKIAYEYADFKAFIDKTKWYWLVAYPFLLAYNYYDEIKSKIGIQESDLVQIVISYSHTILSIAFMVISILVFYIASSYIYSNLPKAYAVLRHISRYSYAGYLVHAYILAIAVAPIAYFGMPYSLPLDIAIYLAAIFLSIELTHIISYFPHSHLLTGLKRADLSNTVVPPKQTIRY